MVCALNLSHPQVHPIWLPHARIAHISSSSGDALALVSFMVFLPLPLSPQSVSLAFSAQAVLLEVPPNVMCVVTYLFSPCLTY